jgi:adenosylhomocysteine nucleosidase
MGVDALVSWGTAGGLDAALRPGDLILPETIIPTDGELLSVDPVWHRHMRHRLAGRIPCRTDPIVESHTVLQNPYEKTLLRKRTGAAAVDMESAAMARVARGASLPFLVVRAVTDPADLSLPRFVPEATDSSGTVDPLGIITGLIRSPKEILPLIRLAGCFRAAQRTLREVLRWAGEDLMAPQAS